jgi:Cof subfamily protein (haloacid dehalogenase superfamily)
VSLDTGPGPIDPLPRLIAFDIDGTLLTSRQELTEATRFALRRLAPRVTFALASARAPSELIPLLDAMPDHTFAIAYQGAWIGEQQGERLVLLEDTEISLASAAAVALDGLSRGLTMGWFHGEQWWVRATDSKVDRHVAITGLAPQVEPGIPKEAPRPHKLMFMASRPELEAELLVLASRVPRDCATHLSHSDYLEVTAAGVDKGTALEYLAGHLGIPMASTMAFGDGDNDIPMLVRAGVGVAMLSGTQEARSAARWITRGNDDDGVAFALNAVFGSDPAGPTALP